MENIKSINYFKDIVSIEQIERGYAQRKKYKIITKNQSYFLKIHNCRLSKKEIIQEKKLYEIYQKLNIPTVPLLDLIEYKKQTIFIYPFFEGLNLKDANLSMKEYYEYGIKVGEEVKKLQKTSVDLKLFPKVNMEER